MGSPNVQWSSGFIEKNIEIMLKLHQGKLTQADFEAELAKGYGQFCSLFLGPLIEQTIWQHIANSETIAFTDLDCAAEGVSRKEETDIVCLSTVPMAFKKAAVFVPLQQDLAEFFDWVLENFCCTTVITRLSPVYMQVMKECSLCSHQLAVSSFLEAVRRALMADPCKERIDNATSEEEKEALLQDISREGEPFADVLKVFESLQSIEDIEKQVDTSQSRYERKLLKVRQERSRVIMDEIDSLMRKTAQYRIRKLSDGTWFGNRGDLYARAAEMWLNYRDNFMVFLDEPHVYPEVLSHDDSERLTQVYCNALRAMQNWPDSPVLTVCNTLTVTETLALNSRIHDAEAWLLEYCRAVGEYLQNWLLQSWAKHGINPLNPPSHIDADTLFEDFDFSAWNPVRARN